MIAIIIAKTVKLANLKSKQQKISNKKIHIKMYKPQHLCDHESRVHFASGGMLGDYKSRC